MVNERNLKLAIMFADVVGSTRLYEVLGDVQAHKQIVQCLAEMSTIITENGGNVLQMIGDEVMCRFHNADAAVKAACKIHKSLSRKSRDNDSQLSVHIGLQYGPVCIEGKDLFGDTVNVAARLAGIANAGQVFTTEETVNNLSPANKVIAREFDCIAVKGKQEEIKTYQIIWEQNTENITSNIPILPLIKLASLSLNIYYQDSETCITANSPAIIVGRSSQCDVVIYSQAISRYHVRFESRRGKIILIDQSTNGTYIRIRDGADLYLHREELWLSGEGIISLGVPISDKNKHLIYFKSVWNNQGHIHKKVI